MLDKLISLWHSREALGRIRDVTACIIELLEHFEENKLKDPTSRDAAIDTVIQLLESKKSVSSK